MTEVVDLPRTQTVAGPPRPGAAGALLHASVGTGVLVVASVPMARVPVIADDFQALHETYATADGSLLAAVRFGLEQGTLAGHFNPFGQAVGAVYHFFAYWLSAQLRVDPLYYDVTAALILTWLSALAGATLATRVLRRATGADLSVWPAFCAVAVLTGITLQIHAPWSNDPVVSYGPAGWGSTALGLWLLAAAVRATSSARSRSRDVVVVGVVAVLCVVYYEMLVAAVAATAVVYAGSVLTEPRASRGWAVRRALVLTVVGVVLPATVFLVGRRLAAPSVEGSYTGTTVVLGPEAVRTWGDGMVGALPAGGWQYLATADQPVVIVAPVLVLSLVLALLTGLAALVLRRGPRLRVVAPGQLVVGVVAVLAFWSAATASHSITAKTIAEIRAPGMVYLFYAVGVVSVAVLGTIALQLLLPRTPSSVVTAGLLVVAVFVVAQVALNWAAVAKIDEIYPHNPDMTALSTDPDAPPAQRCQAMAAWTARPWPEYYRSSVTESVQENYERAFGEPFCPAGIPPGPEQ